jgi:hypothetical protein
LKGKKEVLSVGKNWTTEDEHALCQWVEKGKKKNWSIYYIYHFVAHHLNRSVLECQQKYEELLTDDNWRIRRLEERQEEQQQKIARLNEENARLKQNMTLLEHMLHEQAQLLLKIFGDDQPKLYVHSR